MGPTIQSLVIPVSDLEATKALYTALLGAPHTDEPYYVGYNVNGFEVALNPAGAGGGPVAFADVEDLDADPRDSPCGGSDRARRAASGRTGGAGLRARRSGRQSNRPAWKVARPPARPSRAPG